MSGYEHIAYKLEGGDRVLAAFERLKINTQKSVAAATRAGARPIRNAAEANAQQVSHRSGKHMALKVTARTDDRIVVSVGPTKKFFFLRWFETGTAPHEIKAHGLFGKLIFLGDLGLVIARRVHHSGMAASPVLRPAFDANQQVAYDAMAKSFKRVIEKNEPQAEGPDDGD